MEPSWWDGLEDDSDSASSSFLPSPPMDVKFVFDDSADFTEIFSQLENTLDFYEVPPEKRMKILWNCLTGNARKLVLIALNPIHLRTTYAELKRQHK